jgi:hypothetical protein
MEASGELMDMTAVLKECHKQILSELEGAGISEEEFLPEHKLQLASGLKRVLNWAIVLSTKHQPTHRKGYGEDGGVTSIPYGRELVFPFAGGGGGPMPGPDGGLPDPDDSDEPPDEGSFEWVPEDEQSRARSVMSQVAGETGFGKYDEPFPFVRDVARALGGRWGLNGKRGNANDPSGDILAYDFPGYQPQLFDVLIDGGGKNQLTWSALAYPQRAGAVWLAP